MKRYGWEARVSRSCGRHKDVAKFQNVYKPARMTPEINVKLLERLLIVEDTGICLIR